MPIEFHCLECLQTYEVDDELAGKTIRCRECYTPGKVEPPAKKTEKKSRLKPVHDSDPPPPALEEPARQRKAEADSPSVVRYRCPFCRSERYPRRPIFIGIVAAAMLTVGILAAINYWFFFNIAIGSALERVVNQGLMSINARLAGEISEGERQIRATALMAFTRAPGVCSWQCRRAALSQMPVSGREALPG